MRFKVTWAKVRNKWRVAKFKAMSALGIASQSHSFICYDFMTNGEIVAQYKQPVRLEALSGSGDQIHWGVRGLATMVIGDKSTAIKHINVLHDRKKESIDRWLDGLV